MSLLIARLLRTSTRYYNQKLSVTQFVSLTSQHQPHNFTDSMAAAAAVALNAGTDTCCGSAYLSLNDSVANGWTTEAQMDVSLTRLYNALFTVGYFDGQPQYDGLSWSDVSTGSAQATAYTAAWEGMTLLKNDGTLPLETKYKSVAFVGPWANATGQMQGNYQGTAPYLNSPLSAAQSQWGNVQYAMGTAINTTNTTGFAAALSAAKNADVIIYAGGIDVSIESEGNDRTSIAWPGNQLDLIQQLSALGKPLIVIQFGGGQVDDTALLQNRHVNSLVWAGYPGQDGGPALIDILVGKKSAAGRLTTTQYEADYINQVSLFDPNLRPSNSSPGRTYKWLRYAPVLPFGYGLHYTKFSFSFRQTPRRRIDIGSLVPQKRNYGGQTSVNDASPWTTVTVRVHNTGKRVSDYVSLLFIKTKNAGPAPYPNKSLVSYARLHDLQPGAWEDVQLRLNLGALARADKNGDLVIYPGDYELLFDYDSKITAKFTLTGKSVVINPLVRQQASYNYTVPVHPQA
jgi:beta-D-xylosidase 4